MVRVYFNKHAAIVGSNFVWSIDHGTQATEQVVGRVELLCNMKTDFDPKVKQPNTEEPAAWLYSTTADFCIRDGVAYVGLPTYIASLRY